MSKLTSKFLFLLLVTSCASKKYEVPEKKYFKVSRSSTNKGNPEFHLVPYSQKMAMNNKRAFRNIASTTSSLSNQKIYFLTLYKQYQDFEYLVSGMKDNFSCPYFHNDILTYDSLISSERKLTVQDIEKKFSYESLAYFPELSMKYNGEEAINYVSKSGDYKEVVFNSIKELQKKTKAELVDLCDRGQSDNYYVYENLVNHDKFSKNINLTDNALPIVFKLPVFANLLIMQTAFSKDAIGLNTFEEQSLDRMNVYWINAYIKEIKSKRNKLLVKR